MPMYDLEKFIQDFVDAEIAEHERRKKVAHRLKRLHERLVARIKSGESTGDIARDFILCCGHGFPEPQREQILKKLREVQAFVASTVSQAALIVTTETEMRGESGCFSSRYPDERRSYMMGHLEADRIVLDIEHSAWSLPTSRFVSMGTGEGPTFMNDGLMTPDMGSMLSWYGLSSHGRHDIEFVFGHGAIDDHFAKHHAHRVLARLANSLHIDMGAFPKNAARLAEVK